MSRIASIDFLKFVASFFVVCIHTNTIGKIDGFEVGSLSFIINNVARFAVPFFFVTSGFLIDFNDKRKVFTKLGVVMLVYVIWCLIFVGIRAAIGLPYPNFNFVNVPIVNTVANFLYKAFVYGYERHLWFFPAYIIGVLLIMVFRQRGSVMFLAAALLYLLGLMGDQYSFVFPHKISGFLHFSYFTRSGPFLAFPCMVAGYYLRTKSVAAIRNGLIVTIIAILFLLQYMETVWLQRDFDALHGNFGIVTIFLVTFILIWCVKNKSLSIVPERIARLSGGIFIIHGVFIYLFSILASSVRDETWWIIIYTPLLFILSLATAYVLSCNRHLRKMIFY